MKSRKDLAEFRKKIREIRERDLIKESLRNKNKTSVETLKDGLQISEFAINVKEMFIYEKNKNDISKSS